METFNFRLRTTPPLKVQFSAGVWQSETGIVVGYQMRGSDVEFVLIRPDKNPKIELCVKPEEIK